jgi:hypothetical protein
MSDTYSNYKNTFIKLANLKIAHVPPKLKIEGNEFVVKPEFHITLLAAGKLAEIIDSNNVERLKLELIEEFYTFVDKFPLTRYELLDELRLVKVGDTKTIVVMAKLEGIDTLFDDLSKKHGVKLPVQPTHVTLYTLPTDTFGIRINSYEELQEISEPIEIPKLQKLL